MEITAEEKNVLDQIYGKGIFNSGYSQNQVEDIKELTEEENRFFRRKNFISPHFCVQTLYKVQGEISPLKFNRAVKNLVDTDENFRANFCTVGSRTVKIIFKERAKLPEIIFRVLKAEGEELDEILVKIMEADRRLNFDIQRGNLIRFSIFRTAENESAVLVTLSQLIARSFDSASFFNSVFNGENYKKVESHVNFTPPQIEDRVREYWADILKNLPASPNVPYSKKFVASYQEQIYRMKIPADILSDLRGKAQSNRVMLMTILQTAWGFLLQAANESVDTIFCQLPANSKISQNFLLNLMPVRLKSANDTTVENLVNQQFKQLVISQPYSFFDWATLQNSTYRRNIFDHFLSFLDFKAEEKTYSQLAATPEGKLVVRNSWDAQGMKLGIYFQYAKNLSVSFQYDKNQFLPNAGERLAKLYNLVLRQMLVHWHAPFKDFMENLKKLADFNFTEEIEIAQEDERQKIINFIYQNKILQGEISGNAQILSQGAKLVTRFEGDRISGDMAEKNLVFVVEGKLARSLDTGDGWFNALDIIKNGGLINENIFLKNRRVTTSAEVLTEKAVLMIIPLDNFESAARQNNELYKAMLRHVLSQMEKYQMLWLQS